MQSAKNHKTAPKPILKQPALKEDYEFYQGVESRVEHSESDSLDRILFESGRKSKQPIEDFRLQTKTSRKTTVDIRTKSLEKKE